MGGEIDDAQGSLRVYPGTISSGDTAKCREKGLSAKQKHQRRPGHEVQRGSTAADTPPGL